MFTQYDHIRYFIQSDRRNGKPVWRLVSTSGELIGVYDHRRKAEQAVRELGG